MSYQYKGAVAEREIPIRKTVIEQRKQAMALDAEARHFAGELKSLETRKQSWARKVAESREDLAEIRKQATEELSMLENAKYVARQEIIDAQRQAALIKEMATDQARALSERAYRSGFERGKDIAKAKHAVFAKVLREAA
jgi:hypothetical protein